METEKRREDIHHIRYMGRGERGRQIFLNGYGIEGGTNFKDGIK
jgi:hypothetical protein